jgi:hypothetical protein
MATPDESNNPLIPRDETAAILDQTFGDGDSFSVDQEGDSGAEVPIGSAMCEKILESTADRSQDENDTSVASAAADDYTGDPTAASTPLRTAMEKFRIVDIEKTPQVRGIQQLEFKEGEDNSAGEMEVSCASGDSASAAPAAAAGENSMVSGDAGSTHSDANSATNSNGEDNSTAPSGGESASVSAGTAPEVPRNDGEAGTAGTDKYKKPDTVNSAKSGIPLGQRKVPAMVKPPIMPPPSLPAEKDSVPSDTYKAIMAGRSVNNTPYTLRGTGRACANTDCGSFYNKGDNHVSRSVYKENVAKMYVSSLSFNPVTWECSACPRKHSVLGGGGQDCDSPH